MAKVSHGQSHFNLATDLEHLLEAGPNHLHALGIGYGGFPTWHHLASLMLVACLSSLESTLGHRPWKAFNFAVEEFEVLRCIRNAYVHTGSDLSRVNDASCLGNVVAFHAKLASEQVLGTKNQVISPYFSLNSSVVQLNQTAIRRFRSLYLQLLIAAGVVKP